LEQAKLATAVREPVVVRQGLVVEAELPVQEALVVVPVVVEAVDAVEEGEVDVAAEEAEADVVEEVVVVDEDVSSREWKNGFWRGLGWHRYSYTALRLLYAKLRDVPDFGFVCPQPQTLRRQNEGLVARDGWFVAFGLSSTLLLRTLQQPKLYSLSSNVSTQHSLRWIPHR
jgi:hypothetical protein